MRFVSIVRWFLVAAFLAALVAPTAFSLATGQQFVRVDGESMTPTYQVGDIILIGDPTESDFAVNTVVTIRTAAGELYTHRIVSISDGQAQLKGDGNKFEDPSTITADDVVGVVRAHIGGFPGQAFVLLTTWPARISLLVLLLGLMFAPLTRKGDRDQADSPEGVGTLRSLPAGTSREEPSLLAVSAQGTPDTAVAHWSREQALREEFFASFREAPVGVEVGPVSHTNRELLTLPATAHVSAQEKDTTPVEAEPLHGRRSKAAFPRPDDSHTDSR